MPVEPKILDSSDAILDDIEHHFKVIAGPGAGKTQWLSNHIKNVLNKSRRLDKYRKIACITYTNVGVDTLVKRLSESVDRIEVSTIHSFLYKHVVKPYVFKIKDEYNLDPAKIDGHDDIVPSIGLVEKWKAATIQYYLNDNKKIRNALSDLCWRFNDDDEQLELKLKHPWKAKIGDYSIKSDSFVVYKRMLWESNLLHHDDVLFFSYILMKRFSDILRILRCKFPYFFVDEFQDTNTIQVKILRMLAIEEAIIGVIGDKAQSIYGFQGADVKQFEDFSLSGMNVYQIENNHRSTKEIVTVLNHIRRDITQRNPSDMRGPKPLILIGPALDSFKKTKEIINSDNVCTLSYKNETSCEMKTQHIGHETDDLLLKILFEDNSDRGKAIFSTIKGIEYARLNKFKDAIKEVKKCCNSIDEFDKQKTALQIVYKMLENYESFVNGSLFDFYACLAATNLISITKILTTRVTKIRAFYEDMKYKEIVLWIKYNDDDSSHRTIHKAKGDEFENTLVIIKGRNQDFQEDKDLEFLLKPDLDNDAYST